MMNKTLGHISKWLYMGVIAFSLVSCKVERPDTVLSDEKMEAILYDYHIAKAMGEQVAYDESYKRVLYMESVYKKHGITEAQFDTSMVWFSRHPEVLRDIYEKVNKRLKTEKEKIDDLIAKRDNKPKMSKPGDSIDVWAWQRTYRLTGMPLNNRIQFDLPSDSNFYDRDTLRWSVRFRYEGEGPADTLYAPVMAMQIYYDTDTVLHEMRRIDKSGTELISLWADSLGGIKNVAGFVYYPMQSAGHVLLADEVTLMRYHAEGDSIGSRHSSQRKEAKPLSVRPSAALKK